MATQYAIWRTGLWADGLWGSKVWEQTATPNEGGGSGNSPARRKRSHLGGSLGPIGSERFANLRPVIDGPQAGEESPQSGATAPGGHAELQALLSRLDDLDALGQRGIQTVLTIEQERTQAEQEDEDAAIAAVVALLM